MISTTAELKGAVGGAINASFMFESIAHAVPNIEQDYLQEAFGSTLYDLIKLATDPTDHLHIVRLSCVSAMGWMLLSDYAETGAVQLSSAGIMRVEDGANKSAYRYQEERYRQSVRSKGHDHIERALRNLEEVIRGVPGAAVLAAYAGSPAEASNRRQLVPYADTVKWYHGSKCDRLTYESLRPIMRQYEREGVKTALGTATYDILMGKLLTGEVSDRNPHGGGTVWEQLAELCREAIVLAAVGEAQRRFLVTVVDGRVSLRTQSGDQADVQSASPPADLASISHEHLRQFKDMALSSVVALLESQPDIFTDYATEHADDEDLSPNGVGDFGGVVRL